MDVRLMLEESPVSLLNCLQSATQIWDNPSSKFPRLQVVQRQLRAGSEPAEAILELLELRDKVGLPPFPPQALDYEWRGAAAQRFSIPSNLRPPVLIICGDAFRASW